MAAREIPDLIPSDSPQLSTRTIVALVNKVPVDRIITVIESMLDAETPQGNPDWRARESGVKLWLSYVVGLPVQRQEIIQHKIVSKPDAGKLLATPSALEALARSLAQQPEGKRKLLEALKDE